MFKCNTVDLLPEHQEMIEVGPETSMYNYILLTCGHKLFYQRNFPPTGTLNTETGKVYYFCQSCHNV